VRVKRDPFGDRYVSVADLFEYMTALRSNAVGNADTTNVVNHLMAAFGEIESEMIKCLKADIPLEPLVDMKKELEKL